MYRNSLSHSSQSLSIDEVFPLNWPLGRHRPQCHHGTRRYSWNFALQAAVLYRSASNADSTWVRCFWGRECWATASERQSLIVCQFQQNSLSAAVGTSVGFTLLLAITFSLFRPYNSVVYAPKLKHADDRHAPPPLGKGLFAWVTPVIRTKEADLIDRVGLDATIFLRFTRMCRNIFVILTILGCGILIPVYLTLSISFSFADRATWIQLVTPVNTFAQPLWAVVVCAWLFTAVIAGFLWWNYRAVLRLRRQYFDSPDYQNSLHARTLMVRRIYNPSKTVANPYLDK